MRSDALFMEITMTKKAKLRRMNNTFSGSTTDGVRQHWRMNSKRGVPLQPCPQWIPLAMMLFKLIISKNCADETKGPLISHQRA